MIEIEIDGKTLEVEQGSTIIEVADDAGIYIPRFCYHKKLSIAANCRMCLVEVEKSPKPLPACATPVTAGMKVFTCSQKAKEAQRAVMEFLLINHPLDCPICDQGGECELQDLSLGYGKDASRFTEGKRSVKDDDLGSLVETEMTRCIQCSRCVRFGQEIAGVKELGLMNRGENLQISTYIKHSMESELSGNIIDICPVGALTSKPFRYKARAWELQQAASVAPHDCIGSNIYIHTRRQEVMRAIPRENESINETWISDRDRFSYTAINSKERLTKPMIKQNDQWIEADWVTAFEKIVAGFKNVIEQRGTESIAALASPSSTTEELYLLQKLFRGIGCNNIDHRIHQADFSDQNTAPLYPSLGIGVEELENQDAILLIGSNIHREQPIAGHRVRKASLKGNKVFGVNCVDYQYNFNQQEKIIVSPKQLVAVLAGIAKSLLVQAPDILDSIKPSEIEQKIAEQLKAGSKTVILLGAVAQNHPQASAIRYLSQLIAQASNAKLGFLTEGANSAGAWLAGAVPHRAPAGANVPHAGLSIQEAFKAKLKAYMLLNIEPQLDCANPQLAISALTQADFVVALSPFKANIYLQHADVILPISTFAETSGTFINAEGRWQSFAGVAPAPGEARPAWKVLRVLGNLFELSGFEYASSEEVRDELQQMVSQANPLVGAQHPAPANILRKLSDNQITRITEWPIYAIDSLVRRAEPLQRSATNDQVGIYMNANLADQLHIKERKLLLVKQGDGEAELPVLIDNTIPDQCVWIPAAYEETATLGESFGVIEIVK